MNENFKIPEEKIESIEAGTVDGGVEVSVLTKDENEVVFRYNLSFNSALSVHLSVRVNGTVWLSCMASSEKKIAQAFTEAMNYYNGLEYSMEEKDREAAEARNQQIAKDLFYG